MTRLRAWPWLPVLLLALLVLFWPLLAGGAFSWGLPVMQFAPWRELAAEQLRAGMLPLWNPLNGAGAPLLANYQSGLLYPFNWLTFALPVAWSMSVLAVAHLLIAAAGMAALTRRLGANLLGASTAALAFALGGYMLARLGTYPIVFVAAWLPWMLWAAHSIVAEGRLRDTGWLAVILALALLAGHAQTMWYSALLLGLFCVWQAARVRRPARLLSVALAGMVALCVASVQLAATAELLAVSQRSGGVDFAFAMNYSLRPLSVLTFLSPNLFGTPADGSFLTGGAYFEVAGYIGLLPLAAALYAVLSALRRGGAGRRGDIGFWVLVWLVGLLFALGDSTPVFPLLYQHVPTFDLFQAPARWLIWTTLAGCVLAAYGVTWWGHSRTLRRNTTRLTVGCIGLGLAGGIGWAASGFAVDAGAPVLLRAVFATGMTGALLGVLALRRPAHDGPGAGRWDMLLLALLAADLVVSHAGLNPIDAPVAAQQVAGAGQGRVFWTEAAAEQTAYDDFFRFDDYQSAAGRGDEIAASTLPNLNILTGRPVFNNFDPLLPAHFVAYRALLEAHPDHAGLHHAAGISERRDIAGATQFESRGLASFVALAQYAESDQDAALMLSDPTFDPNQVVMLTGGGERLGSAGAGAAVLADPDAGRFSVITDRPGWLVVSETYYPGWRAQVNGEEVPILRANLAFRAVAVPAGSSEIVFRYEPAWLMPTVILTGVGLLALLVLFMGDRRRTAYNKGSDAA